LCSQLRDKGYCQWPRHHMNGQGIKQMGIALYMQIKQQELQ